MQNPIWSYIFKRKVSEEGQSLKILGKSPVFSDLTVGELKKIYRIVHKREYKKNEEVFSAGDPGIGMYLVLEGRVGVYVIDTETEEENLVAELSAGQSFGDVALFCDSLRTATIKTLSSTKLLGFCRHDLMGFINRTPNLGSKILIQLLKLAGDRLEFNNKLLSDTQRELRLIRKDTETNSEMV